MSFLYKSAKGPRPNTFLWLPNPTDDKRTGHINRLQNAMQDMEESDGVWLASGGDAMYRSYAELQFTFQASLAWLKSNPNHKDYFQNVTDDRVAHLNWCIDFMQIVIQGGLGTMSEYPPNGLVNPATGNPITSLTASALVQGDYEIERVKGAVQSVITANFMIPSGMWTTSEGNIIPVF